MVDLYDVYEIVEEFIGDIGTYLLDDVVTTILTKCYDIFITFIFDSLSKTYGFLLIFSLFLFGFYWKYIYTKT